MNRERIKIYRTAHFKKPGTCACRKFISAKGRIVVTGIGKKPIIANKIMAKANVC